MYGRRRSSSRKRSMTLRSRRSKGLRSRRSKGLRSRRSKSRSKRRSKRRSKSRSKRRSKSRSKSRSKRRSRGGVGKVKSRPYPSILRKPRRISSSDLDMLSAAQAREIMKHKPSVDAYQSKKRKNDRLKQAHARLKQAQIDRDLVNHFG
jgi:hypothetical protein